MSNITRLVFLVVLAAACRKKPVATEVPFEEPAAPVARTEAVPEEVQEMKQNFIRVNFDYDSYSVNAAARDALAANAKIMSDHPNLTLQVQGHCDERGTTEYNMALGSKRADAVRKVLTSQGVAPSRVKTISYGEERPLMNQATETAWSENRRAEFSISWPSSASSSEVSSVQGTVN